MKMRDLEAATGVNRETIRVYFRHGLLPEPKRSKPNVADYDQAHVDGIRLIRRLHKEEGMTLPQIKRVLSGDVSDPSLSIGAFPHLEQLVAARLDRYDALVPLASVIERNPQAEEDAHALQEIKAVRLKEQDGERFRFEQQPAIHAGYGTAGSLIPPHEYHTIANDNGDDVAVTVHIYRGEMKQCNMFRHVEGEWYERCDKALCLDK